MEKIQLVCPNCNSNLEFRDDRQIAYCEYCGTKILLTDEIKYTKYTKNVNVNNTYTKMDKTKIREAEIQRDICIQELNSEERKAKRENRMFAYSIIGLVVFMILCIGAIELTEFFDKKKETQMEAKGMISIGSYEEFEGKKYDGVVSKLKALGFKNIETIDLDDWGFFTNKANTIESVSINGNSKFDSDDYFNPTDKVVITYH